MHSSQNVHLLLIDLHAVLIAKLTHICLHFFIQLSELPIQYFLLTEPPLEHANLIPEFIILKLILVSFAAHLLIALLSQFPELALLAILKL